MHREKIQQPFKGETINVTCTCPTSYRAGHEQKLPITLTLNRRLGNKLKMESERMIIEELENKVPHILKMARENLSEIKFGSHTVDEEIEQSTPEYLIAYAYRERGISIPDCIVLLSDYRRLQNINGSGE